MTHGGFHKGILTSPPERERLLEAGGPLADHLESATMNEIQDGAD